MSTMHRKVAPDTLLDALTDELIGMTDEQVLAGEDPALELAQGRDLLRKAVADAGKRRLATAKAAVEARRRSPPPATTSATVTALQAREFLESAQNDPRFTMAARQLSDMSDEDVLRAYNQLLRLMKQDAADESGK